MSRRQYIRVDRLNPREWIRVRDTLYRMADGEILDRVQGSIYANLEEGAQKIKALIESGALPFAPLKEKYLKYKQTHGLNTNILIATGAYVNSFSVFRVGRKTLVLRPVGKTETGIPMEELGVMLEYGTNTMPARPHMIFLREEILDDIRRDVQGIMSRFARTGR